VARKTEIHNGDTLYTLYAKETGKILETYFYLNDARISEKRLIRFGLAGN
jgi:hypothetical protein